MKLGPLMSMMNHFGTARVALAVMVTLDAAGCRRSSSESPDGGGGEPSFSPPGGAPQHADLLSGYAVKPPWQVASVDYYVGAPSGTLKDPAADALPSGVTYSGTQAVISASNVVLDGFDFTQHGPCMVVVSPNVSNTQILNNRITSLYVGSGASGVYAVYNTIDFGGTAGATVSGANVVETLGHDLTLEYNWIENGSQHVIDVNSAANDDEQLTVEYNLFEDGNWGNGFSPDTVLQFDGGNNVKPEVTYNTILQHWTAHVGDGIQMYLNMSGAISDGEIANNTIVALPGAGSGQSPFTNLIQAGTSEAFPWSATGAVHDNYIDPSGVSNDVFDASLSGFSYSNNVNLTTGTAI